jgi:hypothetical protein
VLGVMGIPQTTLPEPAAGMTAAEAEAVLGAGAIQLHGALPWSSNATLLVTVADGEQSLLAVYKPRSGERPLWDFRTGSLCQREMAAYVLSRYLGWPQVPPTLLREGPFGSGALQLFVDHDPEDHFLTLTADQRRAALPIAVFDIVANNADRKSGHVLVDPDGSLWAIDHGITFHREPKLRTVIWDFAGEPLPPVLLAGVRALADDLADPDSGPASDLAPLLSRAEIAAIRRRALRLVADGTLPVPDPDGHVIPWPPV